MSKKLQVAAVLFLTLVIFLPALRYSLVSDDHMLIESNPRIAAWTYVPGYFTTHLIAHLPGQIAPYYRPIFLLWLRLCDVVFGTPGPVWHLASILIHLLATAAVFAFANKLTGNFRASLLAAGLFGVHPIHTEAVCWISDSQDILVTLFLIGSVYFYAVRKGPISFVSLLFASLAMFTKEPGVLAPVLIFAYAWSKEDFKQAMLAAVQYLPPVFLYWVLRSRALGIFVGGGSASMSVTEMIYTWPQILGTYVMHLLWPFHLSMCYEVHARKELWPLLLVALAVAALVWLIRKAEPNVRFAVLWIGVTLLPALAIRYLTAGDYVHDRYLYLPTVGLALILAELQNRVQITSTRAVIFTAIAVGCCVTTVYDSKIWRDDISLYQRGIEVAPNSAIAGINLAQVYLQAHRGQEALPLLQRVIATNPNECLAYLNMAQYYDQAGNPAAANYYYSIYLKVVASQTTVIQGGPSAN